MTDEVKLRYRITRAVRRSDLPAASRLIMMVLADVAEVGTAEVPPHRTPSVVVLARETGLDRTTVQRHLSLLDAAGWIVRTRPAPEDLWAGERVRYRLTSPDEVAVSGGHPGGTEPHPGGTEHQGVAAQNIRGGGTEPPLKRSTDKSEMKEIKPSSRRRGSRLPEPFDVTDDMVVWARQHAPDVSRSEHARFCDYWRATPGQRGVKLDWVATWRNWMRKAQDDAEYRKPRANGHKPSTTDQRVNDALALKHQMRGGTDRSITA